MDSLPESNPKPIILTTQENRVYGILENLSEGENQFGRWYLGALLTLRANGEDAIAQAAHSLREITDCLPSRLGITAYDSPLPVARDVAVAILRIKDASYKEGWNDKEINKALAKQLSRLDALRKVAEATPRTRRLGVAFSKHHPSAELQAELLRKDKDDEFKDTVSFFQGVAHHNIHPSKEDFQAKLSLFEQLIISYLSPATAEQQREITGIIQNPGDKESEVRLKWLITHNPSNLLFFLQKIEDPVWLKFCKGIGLLDFGGKVDQAAARRYDPVLNTLVRLAPIAPDEVCSILESLPKDLGEFNMDQIMRCMASIPDATYSERCAKVLCNLLRDKAGRYVFLEDVLANWVRQGCYTVVLKILEKYICNMMHPDPQDRMMTKYLLEQIESKFLVPLEVAREQEFRNIYFYALKFWRRLQNQQTYDKYTYWFQDFKQTVFHDHFQAGILLKRLYQLGRAIYLKQDEQQIGEFDQLLRSNSWELFKRLRWQLYADFPEQSLAWAKADVLAEIPSMNSYNGSHGYEMAQLLDAHVKKYGSEFLTQSEVNDFFEKVMEGPIEKNEKTDIDDVMIRRFQRRQLQPIAPLLSQEQKVVYEELTKEFPGELALQDYKPFKSGRAYSVKSVTPATTVELAAMNDMAIWKFLNDWLPKNDWRETGGEAIEETVGELGREFSNLFTQNPERFSASSEWWKNIKRPEILSKLLDAATQRITSEKKAARSTEEPKPDQWVAWFGIVDRILELSNDDSPAALDEYKQNVWNWPRRVVVQFMENVIQREQGIPQGYEKRVGEVLQTILLKPDLTESRENPNLDDWLSYAINSVKGSALEALLALAIRQKNSKKVPPETWIYETICKVLCDSDVSPALFAVMGARLRAVLYLYAEQFKQEPEVLMPNDKPEMTEAFIVAHIKYGTWVNQLLEVFPDYPDRALGLLHAKNLETEEDERDRNDYGGRLGLHLCFYFWNDMYGTPESGVRILKRFFRIANPHQRAETIGEISRIFKNEKASDDLTQMLHRLKQIWDLRIQDIEEKQKSEELTDEDILKEVGSFIRWIEIQAMDFTWRHEQIVRALKLCKKAPEHLIYIRDLLNQHTEPNELKGRLEIFKHILQLSNDSNTWYYRDKELIPVLKSALNSEDPQTQQHAKEVQEILLRRGCFEFLMDEERHENE